MTDQIAVQSNGISITADGQIIVSKLRPMREAPNDGTLICAFNNDLDDFVAVYYSDYYKCFVYSPIYRPSQQSLIGWIKMPIYKTE